MITYKVFAKVPDKEVLRSVYTNWKYKRGVKIHAPENLFKLGYGLTAFDSLLTAQDFACCHRGPEELGIWEVEVGLPLMELPEWRGPGQRSDTVEHLYDILSDLLNEPQGYWSDREVSLCDDPWPKGTIMVPWVRLTERLVTYWRIY